MPNFSTSPRNDTKPENTLFDAAPQCPQPLQLLMLCEGAEEGLQVTTASEAAAGTSHPAPAAC